MDTDTIYTQNSDTKMIVQQNVNSSKEWSKKKTISAEAALKNVWLVKTAQDKWSDVNY